MAGPLSIEFAMPGKPIAEGSLAPNWGGRPCGSCGRRAFIGLRPQLRDLDPWRNDVARLATMAMRRAMRPWIGPVAAELILVVPAPKDIPKERHGYPIVPPDLDKLERAIYDACTGIVYKDDAQIVEHRNLKRYPIDREQPGVIVRMRALVPEGEAERPRAESIWKE